MGIKHNCETSASCIYRFNEETKDEEFWDFTLERWNTDFNICCINTTFMCMKEVQKRELTCAIRDVKVEYTIDSNSPSVEYNNGHLIRIY